MYIIGLLLVFYKKTAPVFFYKKTAPVFFYKKTAPVFFYKKTGAIIGLLLVFLQKRQRLKKGAVFKICSHIFMIFKVKLE